MFSFFRKHIDVQNTDISVNTIAGSRKKRRKKATQDESDLSDSDNDDEESIHTSDMSTDEEDSGDVTLVKSEVEESIATNQEKPGEMDNEVKKENELNGNSDQGVNSEEEEETSVLIISKKSRVRSTSGKWAVKELVRKTNKNVKSELGKNNTHSTESKSEDRGSKVTENAKVTNNCKENGVSENNFNLENKETSSNVSSSHLEKKITIKESEKVSKVDGVKVERQKAVNVPVERESIIQVAFYLLYHLLWFVLQQIKRVLRRINKIKK